jgi:hypothetical protein
LRQAELQRLCHYTNETIVERCSCDPTGSEEPHNAIHQGNSSRYRLKAWGGISNVAHTMVHGQHSMNGLLGATDAKLKKGLSLVVPLALWHQGMMLARARSRDASKKAAEFGVMISLRARVTWKD